MIGSRQAVSPMLSQAEDETGEREAKERRSAVWRHYRTAVEQAL